MESDTDSGLKFNLISRIKTAFSLFGNRNNSKEVNFKKLSYDNIEHSKQEMIRGVLQLSELNAREIMIPRVDSFAVNTETGLKELIDLINAAGHSRIPVFEETIDNITGILYVKDLLSFVTNKRKKFDIKKLLHKPLFIPETMPLDELLVEFKKQRQHLAIVIDEYGGIAGIVTMEDILEEIVGDINDEYDEADLPELIKISKNSFDIDSRMSIDDLNREININLPTEEFDTIGGFTLDIFGKIPEQSDIVKYKNISIKVKEIEGTRINRLILTITSSRNGNSKN